MFDPSIYSDYARTYSQNSSNLGAALGQAVQNYQTGEARKQANLEEARRIELEKQKIQAAQLQRQAKLQEEQRLAALQPQNILARSLQGQELTPEEESTFQAYQQLESAQRRVDPTTGQVYAPYQPVSLGGGSSLAQTIAQPLQATPTPQAQGGYDTLLPPPVYDGGETRAPSPLGEKDVKVSDLTRGINVSPKSRQLAEEEAIKARGALSKESAQRQVEKVSDRPRANFAFRKLAKDFRNIEQTTNQAISDSSKLNTGAFAGTEGKGRLGSGFLTGGVNLSSTLKSVQADAAFDTLQQMRDASKTGGALGSVSERELSLLQNAKVPLDQNQSEEQLDKNLKRYIDIRKDALKNVAEAYKEDYGEYPEGFEPPKEQRLKFNPETGELE